MTKQGEIRNWLIDLLDRTETAYTDEADRPRGYVDEILAYLKSKGCVIRVEGEWAEIVNEGVYHKSNGVFYKVEPLIEE